MPNYKDQAGKLHFLDSEDYEHLLPKGCTKITDEEAAEIRIASTIPPTYAMQRLAEYPPMADYLDGIVKGDQKQIATYIAACKAVKAKYPKP